MPCSEHTKTDKAYKACKSCMEVDDDSKMEDVLRKTDKVLKSLDSLKETLSKALNASAARSIATATTRDSLLVEAGIMTPELQTVAEAKMQNSLVMHGVPGGRIIPYKIPEQFAIPETAKDYESCPVCCQMVLEGVDCPGCARLGKLSPSDSSMDWSR